jgi:hypothetical protein
MRTSNFALKPVRVTIREATEAELAAVPKVPVLRSQRTPAQFRNAAIKADRALIADPDYVSGFTNDPIVETDLWIDLPPDLAADFDRLADHQRYGDDDGAALRDILFTWWEERFLHAASGAPSLDPDR